MNRKDCLILIIFSISIVICVYLLYRQTVFTEKYNIQTNNTNSNTKQTIEQSKEQNINQNEKFYNCPPYTMIDPIEFTNFLRKNNILSEQEFKIVNSKYLPQLPRADIISKKVDSYLKVQKYTQTNQENNKENNKDKNKTNNQNQVVSYIINLLPYFPFELWDKIFNAIVFNSNLVDIIINTMKPDCKKMNGNQAIGVIFVESSSRDGPKFSDNVKRDLKSSINRALNTLKNNHPTGNLTWKTDFQYVEIDVENGPLVELTAGIRDKYTYDSYWRTPGLSRVRFNNKSFNTEDEYLNELKTVLRCDFASVYFITPYNTSYPAYASFKRQTVVISNNHDYVGWGIDDVWKVMMHECCHLFGAPDEYVTTGGGTSCTSCVTTTGCNNVVNGNCQLCVDEQVSTKCVMIKNEADFCTYTKAQIGWIDTYIKVRVVTSRDRWSGTDNPIKITFYRRRSNDRVTYDLNTPGYNDFEMGDDDWYILPVYNSNDPIINFGNYTVSIEPIIGVINDFKLNKVQVFKNEELISDKTPNVWLTSDRKSWNSF